MQTEVIATADVTAELDALAYAVYGPPEQQDDLFASITWATPEISVMVHHHERDAMVAHAGVLVRDGLLNGEAVRIGGLGGVKTHPDVRGQRLGKAVVTRAGELMRDELDVDFGLLVCLDDVLPYYQQLGWSEFAGELRVDQPDGPLLFNELISVMAFPGRVSAPKDGVIDLRGFPW